MLHISCSGSIACDEHKSSTSCLERSWLGNRLHTPSPEEHKTRLIHQDWKEGKQEERPTHDALVSYPSLAGFSCTALIHIPVPLPLPAAGWQLKTVERLRIHPSHVAPRPAVRRQQRVSEAVHRVPPLKAHTYSTLVWTTFSIHVVSVTTCCLGQPGFHRSLLCSGWRSHWASC